MEIGRVLGPYTLERKLGEGGMGVVYAARHERIGRLYALKVLLPDLAKRPDALARFEREARSLSALGHPNIVAVHDFAVEPDGTAYLAMDLLEGVELARAIGGLPMPPSRVRRIAMDVAAGLAAAHRLGLVHRDLKPSNVFLVGHGERERAVLLDFGLAKALEPNAETAPLLGDKLTASGTILGTPHYMSPEQAQGAALDTRVDVWAFGAALYEMLAGRPPFDGPTVAAVFAAILTSDPLPLARGGALSALALRCLDRDRDRRPRDGAALLLALEGMGDVEEVPRSLELAVTQAVPLPAQPPTRAPRDPHAEQPAVHRAAPSRPRPRRLAAIGTAVLVASLGCVGAWLAWPGAEPAPVSPARVPIVVTPIVDAGADSSFELLARPRVDAGVDAGAPAAPGAALAASPSRPSHHGAAARVGDDPVPAVRPLGAAAPPPPSDPVTASATSALLAATPLMQEGDWEGCLRALAPAPPTLQVLSIRMSCASNAHDRPALERTCQAMHERFPRALYNESCASLLATSP